MLRRPLLLMVGALLAILAAGCVSPVAALTGSATPVPSEAETPNSGSTGGLAKDVASRAIEWLAGEKNVPVADVRLVRAERTEWTDSCFGLGGPTESCLQASTPGWRITFEAAGQQYEVRTDESGSSFRLAPKGS